MTTTRLLFPKALIVTPRDKHIVLVNYHWALTNDDFVIVHKWFDDNMETQYAPQCNTLEVSIVRICQANKVEKHEIIPLAYMPYYIMKAYIG